MDYRKIAIFCALGMMGFLPSQAEDLSPAKNNLLEVDSTPQIFGTILIDKNWGSDESKQRASMGLYRFHGEKNLAAKRVFASSSMYLMAGTCVDGLYYTMGQDVSNGVVTGNTFRVFKTSNWSLATHERTIDTDANIAGAYAYDPVTDNLYGIGENEWSSTLTELSKFNIISGKATLLYSYYNDYHTFTTLACDSKGQLWGIDNKGDLYKIDKSTYALTRIGYTGIDPRYYQSMCFDYRTGKLYWYASDMSANFALYEVNTTTGRATRISDYQDQHYIATYIENPVYGTPDMPTDLLYTATGNKTSGTLSFRLPTKTFDGKSLSGHNLSVTVAIEDGDTINTDAIYKGGDEVSLPISLPRGQSRIGISASTDTGQGLIARVKTWTGEDIPAQVENFKVTGADGPLALSWLPVTTGKNDGYVDPDRITYSVYRNDGSLVADGLTTSSFTDASAADSKYSYVFYTIVAKNNEGASDSVRSNAVVAGKGITPDYTENFSGGVAGQGSWFELNNLNKAKAWTITAGGTDPDVSDNVLTFNCYSNAVPTGTVSDIISPAVNLSNASSAKFTFDLYHYQGIFETIDDVVPIVVTRDGSIHEIGSPIERGANNNGWTSYSLDISAYAGQVVCVGFKGTSDYGFNIHIRNVAVQVQTSTGISTVKAVGGLNDDGPWYNLQGQRISRPQHGTFIHNGRKVVVK